MDSALIQDTVLLCTFSSKSRYLSDIDDIRNRYEIWCGKIYVLDCEEGDTVFITYNAIKQASPITETATTIRIHRKKEYNVLYSINALNATSTPIDWSKYRNSIVVKHNDEVIVRRTNLRELFYFGQRAI